MAVPTSYLALLYFFLYGFPFVSSSHKMTNSLSWPELPSLFRSLNMIKLQKSMVVLTTIYTAVNKVLHKYFLIVFSCYTSLSFFDLLYPMLPMRFIPRIVVILLLTHLAGVLSTIGFSTIDIKLLTGFLFFTCGTSLQHLKFRFF